ncbi:hypothetical protein A9Q81_04295 [Gammaproteobacteria bacterium 42_54_T18]|nr:hypothetical protein A9Q81_04295 [Gammaproteobacteria bacterium 42_54_T18]
MLTINSHFIRAILGKADQYGVDVHTVLDECGISSEIYQEQQGVVHVDQFVRLVQRAWYWFDDEYWGLSGTRCQPGLFALMVRYVQQFDTLGALLNELCRFYNTTRDDGEFSVDFQGDDVTFSVKLLKPELDVDHFLSEFQMVSFHRFFGWICSKRIILDRVTFAYAKPEHSYAYRILFPCERVYDQSQNSFVFNKRYLASPLVRSSAELKAFLKTAPADLLVRPTTDDSYSTRIKGMLLEPLRKGDGFPDFNSVASTLCVSPQTLRRKLKVENSNFQEIKDNIRRDLAVDKLVNERLAVADISSLLGFSESSSFTRAFKQWTGVSPADYRLKVSGG